MFIQEGPRDGNLYGKGELGVLCLETVYAWQIQWVVLDGIFTGWGEAFGK